MLLVLFYPALVLLSPRQVALDSGAYEYVDSKGEKSQLPKIAIDGENLVQLSVVVPAYNEEKRLPKMLREVVQYLEAFRGDKRSILGVVPPSTNGHARQSAAKSALQHALTSYEILIIDDGSQDRTVEVATQFAAEHPNADLRIVRMGRNRGKGAAVRHGVLHTRGQIVLFCDADGATRFSDVTTLAAEMDKISTTTGHGIVCGSRAHLVDSDAVVKVGSRCVADDYLADDSLYSAHSFGTSSCTRFTWYYPS